MRVSPKRHPLAVLRLKLEMHQQEFADLVHTTKPTIQKVEHGKLPLSESLAQRVAHETDVSVVWLIEGNPKVPPVTCSGEPFTREIYERAQSLKTRRDSPKGWNFSVRFLALAGQLRAVLMRAEKKRDFTLASYQVRKFLNSLALKYGALKTGRDPENAHRDIGMVYPADAKAMRADLKADAEAINAALSELESCFPFLTKWQPPAPGARRASGREGRT